MITFDLRSLQLVEVRDGFVFAQPQTYGSNGKDTSYEMIQPFGLCSRPRDATDDLGANALVLLHGSEGYTIATTDPRYQASLPDFGDGGAALYATAEVSGAVQTPYLAFYGKGGDKDEGTLRAEVQTAAGATTIEVNASTGDVTIEHAAGTKVVVKSDGVVLGDDTAVPLVKYAALAAAWAGLTTACAAKGITVPALVSADTQKVKGT